MTQQFSQADIDSAIEAARIQIRDNWGWFLALGIVFVVAGIVAIAFPLLSTIAAKIVLGWIFIIGGMLMMMHAFSSLGWRGFLTSVLIGVLYVLAGAWLAFFPFTGIITLTLILRGAVHCRGRAGGGDGLPRAPTRGVGVVAAERHRGDCGGRADRAGPAELGDMGHRAVDGAKSALDWRQLYRAGPGWPARGRSGSGLTSGREA